MKEIAQSEVEKLLTIIQPAPLLRIGHFSDQAETLSDLLYQYCEHYDYEYILNCTKASYYKKLQSLYQESAVCHMQSFNLDRPNYMQHGKFYDYLFVSCDVPPEARESFLQKTHSIIKNAGLILLFVPTVERKALAHWTRLLEENYFVATNTIDLDREWSVVISKKMHGWGG